MACLITATATLQNDFAASVNLTAVLSSVSNITSNLISFSSVIDDRIQVTTIVINEKFIASAGLVNSGVNAAACPILYCIDGGNAYTTTWPIVNGLLNGGTA